MPRIGLTPLVSMGLLSVEWVCLEDLVHWKLWCAVTGRTRVHSHTHPPPNSWLHAWLFLWGFLRHAAIHSLHFDMNLTTTIGPNETANWFAAQAKKNTGNIRRAGDGQSTKGLGVHIMWLFCSHRGKSLLSWHLNHTQNSLLLTVKYLHLFISHNKKALFLLM